MPVIPAIVNVPPSEKNPRVDATVSEVCVLSIVWLAPETVVVGAIAFVSWK